MALINCPGCGKGISDKAFVCPQCGTQLQEKEILAKHCQECGEELTNEETVCHKCGCPVSLEKSSIDLENGIKFSKKKTAVIVVIIIAIIGIIFAVNNYQKQAAEKQISEDYATNLELASYSMLDGAFDAENAGNLIHSVWYNTIFDISDSETDQYTKTNGVSNNDFNDSLQALFSDSSFQATISSIKSNQETTKSLIKELTNPPEEYAEAYSTLKDYYDAYLELTNLVINPTGSLQSFTSDFNSADSEVSKCYEAMKIYIE